jgi:hypothetical protein
MARRDAVLQAFARLLPGDFRERVFDPALADLWLDEGGIDARRSRRWVARLVIIAECLRIGIPQFVWRRGRPTRLGGVLLVATLVGGLLMQRHNYAGAAGVAPSQNNPPSIPGHYHAHTTRR